jgi:penicillin-binding protein 2
LPSITIKDTFLESRLVQSRIVLAGMIVGVLTALLIARLAYLQISGHDHFVTLARNNRIHVDPLPPVRGLIYDRNGVVLAENFPAYSLEITPDQVGDMEELIEEVGRLVVVAPEDMRRFRRVLRQRPAFEGQPLRHLLTEHEAATLAVNLFKLKGAKLLARLQRQYPLGSLGVHVVGYVGRISERDLQRIDTSRYRGTEYLGKLGVEASYEERLMGRPGYEQVETNAHGRVVRVLSRTPPSSGQNLILTLDARLQSVAETAMAGRRGAVVALDPRTGAVLALASTPTYDPNAFVNGIDQASYRKLSTSLDRPLLNRALSGRYAPGSTIKPLMALAALDFGRPPDKTTFCPGFFRLPGRTHQYRCWKKSGHGPMDLHDAVVQSCDVYFYDLASRMGINRVHDFLSGFGLGRPTGIDMDGEAGGLLPSEQWKRRVRGQPWYPGETVITGIGQGYTLATPLQLAYATAVIANRGRGLRPHMVQAIEDPVTGERIPVAPEVHSVLDLKRAEYMDEVIEAMTDVVHGPRGTARRIGVDAPYRIAGKTGTAQVVGIAQDERYDEDKVPERLRDHALFIAFAPVDDPRIAVAVVIENGGHGSSVAAPVARTVMDAYLLGEKEHTEPEVTASMTETAR